MKNLYNLTLESGPKTRLTLHHRGGGTGTATPGLEDFLDHALDRNRRWTITDKEFAERVWKICIKRRAPQNVLVALAQWRHILEDRENRDSIGGELNEKEERK